MSACLRLDTSPHAVSAVHVTVSRQITHTAQGSRSLLMLRGEYRLRDSSDITRTLLQYNATMFPLAEWSLSTNPGSVSSVLEGRR